jgi:hypothetical protein
MQEATEKLIALIPNACPVDLQPLFFRFSLETTTHLLFNRSIGALEQSDNEGVAGREAKFAEAFTIAQD